VKRAQAARRHACRHRGGADVLEHAVIDESQRFAASAPRGRRS